MPIDIPTLNLVALAPELVVIVTAVLAILLDMFVEDKRVIGYVSLAGLAGSAAVCFGLLGASPAPAMQNMAVSDGYSLVLDLVFVTTAALSVLIALSYLKRQRYAARRVLHPAALCHQRHDADGCSHRFNRGFSGAGDYVHVPFMFWPPSTAGKWLPVRPG